MANGLSERGGIRRVFPDDVLALIDDLTDPDDCWFDHHGYCQAHGWFETEPICPHRRAKELLKEVRG